MKCVFLSKILFCFQTALHEGFEVNAQDQWKTEMVERAYVLIINKPTEKHR